MKITPKLRSFLETKGLKAGASDDEALAFVKDGLASGKLADADVQAHAGEEGVKSADTAIDGLLAEKLTPVTKAIADMAAVMGDAVKGLALLSQPAEGEGPRFMPFGPGTPEGGKSGQPRVKGAHEQYDPSRKNLYHPAITRKGMKNVIGGLPVTDENGRQMESQSQRDLAVIGACMKHQLRKAQGTENTKLSEHERQLVEYAAHELEWTGPVTESHPDAPGPQRKLSDLEVKALLNDGTSGGQYAVPLVYDDAVIQTALLYGELFPFVNVINLDRGNSVHGYSIQRPTLQANVAEGTAITLFNTASFVGTFDTTIYTVVGAMEFGLDWQEDSPVDVAQLAIKEFGEAGLAYLDKVIAVGDGTTQPTGIFTASNTVNVPNISNGVGPLSVGDFEALYFGLTKAERNWPRKYLTYVGNDNTYRRSRAIPLGTDDARRFYGNDYDNYMVSGRPFKVSVDVADYQLAFCNLQRYRMYRRLGGTFRYVNDGQTLALKNTSMVVYRGRFGGQPELGAGFAIMPNAPTQG